MTDPSHIKDLIPDANNARLHTPRNIGVIERSLHDVGAARSIVIDEDNHILAGNGTVAAAAQAGIERVQIVEADGETIIAVRRRGLTPEQKIRLALADNRASELASWDGSVLAGLADAHGTAILDGLFTDDEQIEVFQGVADGLLMESEPDEPVEIDEARPTRAQPGDVWRVGRHTVACLSSTERENVERLTAGRKVAMVVADPPYGIDIVTTDGYIGGGEKYNIPFGGVKNRAAAKRLIASNGSDHVVKAGRYAPVIGDDTAETAIAASALALGSFPRASQFWWGANNYAHTLPPTTCWIVWDKDNTGNFADAELAWSNHRGAVRIFKHQWNGMVRASERGRRVHPTQKPIALFAWLYGKYGAAGDTIFDPFLGSGPSLKAAEQTGRTVIGCELSPHYVEHILSWGETHGLTVERDNG